MASALSNLHGAHGLTSTVGRGKGYNNYRTRLKPGVTGGDGTLMMVIISPVFQVLDFNRSQHLRTTALCVTCHPSHADKASSTSSTLTLQLPWPCPTFPCLPLCPQPGGCLSLSPAYSCRCGWSQATQRCCCRACHPLMRACRTERTRTAHAQLTRGGDKAAIGSAQDSADAARVRKGRHRGQGRHGRAALGLSRPPVHTTLPAAPLPMVQHPHRSYAARACARHRTRSPDARTRASCRIHRL
jgi:hypothetical protein